MPSGRSRAKTGSPPAIAVTQGAIHVNSVRLEEIADSYMNLTIDCRAKYFTARVDPSDCRTIVLGRIPRTVKSDGGWKTTKITIMPLEGFWQATYVDPGRYTVEIRLHRTPTEVLPRIRQVIWLDPAPRQQREADHGPDAT